MAFLVPFGQHKQVHILASVFVVAVHLASYAYLEFFRKLPNLVNVADSGIDLVLVLNKGILFFECLTRLRLGEVNVIVAGTGCFFHQLAHTVDAFFI